MKAGESLPLFVSRVFLTIILNECKMANKYFYTYIHGTENSANNSYIPRKVALSYWNSLIFDVNHRTIWHQGMPFGNVYPGTLSYGETFNDIDNNIAQGPYAHAEGKNTKAMYNDTTYVYGSEEWLDHHDNAKGGMHAEGDSTIATGLAAHAEGAKTAASGTASHTEGYSTSASGDYSHAEGKESSATYLASHAEGNDTRAMQLASHAEGDTTVATGIASHSEGKSTVALGANSHAEGWQSVAKGDGSHAEGNSSTDSDYSHSEGQGKIDENSMYAHAENGGQVTGSQYAHAEGNSTVQSAPYGHAEGHGTMVKGCLAGHSEGTQTSANGNNSHAEGNSTIAEGPASHTEGTLTHTYTDAHNSHAEGDSTFIINSKAAHAEGYDTAINRSNYAHTEGRATYIYKSAASHAEGEANTIWYAENAHVEGNGNTCYGLYSHAEGDSNIATGTASHAQGKTNVANGSNSFVTGRYNTVDGFNSSVLGGEGNTIRIYVHNSVTAGQKNSLSNYAVNGKQVNVGSQAAFGTGLMTTNDCEFATGMFNFSYANGISGTDEFSGGLGTYWTIFSVGNGQSGKDERSNAMDIRSNGHAVFYKEAFGWDNGHETNQACFPEGIYPFATRQYVDRHDVGLRNWEGSGTAPNYTYKYVNAEYFNDYLDNYAGADYSHAEGQHTTTYGIASHAEGYGTITYNYGEHASGTWNASTKGETIFSVGGGIGPGLERNLLEVKYANQENGIAFVDGKPIVTAISPRIADLSTYIWTGTFDEYKAVGGENGTDYDDRTLYFVEDGDAVNRNDIITRDDIMGLVDTMNSSLDQKMNGVVKSAATLAETNNGILQKIGQSCSMSVTYSYIWTGSKAEYEDLMTYLNKNLFANPPKNANDANYVAYTIAKNMQYIIHM